jgi:hypothetical protein
VIVDAVINPNELTREGRFDADSFKDQAAHPHVKMVELKLSQGAKPVWRDRDGATRHGVAFQQDAQPCHRRGQCCRSLWARFDS